MMEHPWEGAMEPFKIFGNTYFVGTKPASSHLIDTGSGLILLDSGYQESLYLVLESIRKLGFDPHDIRYIVHSHGHIDHAAATRALVEMVHAETFLGEEDRGMVSGENQLGWAPEYDMSFNGLSSLIICCVTAIKSRLATLRSTVPQLPDIRPERSPFSGPERRMDDGFVLEPWAEPDSTV